MTKTEAMAAAHERIGELYECAPGQWGYNTWSDYHSAWWLPHGQPYHQALHYRCAAIAGAAARAYLMAQGAPEYDEDGCPLLDTLELQTDEMEGSARERFNRLVDAVSRPKPIRASRGGPNTDG